MTWVATGVSAGGAVMSGVGASKAGKSAAKNASSQQQLLAQDLAERQRVARRQEEMYGPIEQQMISQAMARGIDPVRAGLVRSTVGNEFNNADRGIQTMIGTRGIASGLGASMLGNSQMNRARAMAGGLLAEYQNKDQLRAGLLQRYNPLQNAEFQSQGLRGMASFYGDQANQARQAEMMGWQGAAQGLMGAGMMYARGAGVRPPGKAAPSASDVSKPGLGSSALPQSDGVIPDIPNGPSAADAYSSRYGGGYSPIGVSGFGNANLGGSMGTPNTTPWASGFGGSGLGNGTGWSSPTWGQNSIFGRGR